MQHPWQINLILLSLPSVVDLQVSKALATLSRTKKPLGRWAWIKSPPIKWDQASLKPSPQPKVPSLVTVCLVKPMLAPVFRPTLRVLLHNSLQMHSLSSRILFSVRAAKRNCSSLHKTHPSLQSADRILNSSHQETLWLEAVSSSFLLQTWWTLVVPMQPPHLQMTATTHSLGTQAPLKPHQPPTKDRSAVVARVLHLETPLASALQADRSQEQDKAVASCPS